LRQFFACGAHVIICERIGAAPAALSAEAASAAAEPSASAPLLLLRCRTQLRNALAVLAHSR
jgi:hypothetical protein